MARIVVVSSWVAYGHVGLSAVAPALQVLGHELVQFPTVVLSNHLGWSSVSGDRVAPEMLSGMLDAVEENGWLYDVDAVLTGYFPTPGHVDFAADVIDRVRRHSSGARVVVDPVLGDDPRGLYVDEDAAVAVRDRLLPFGDAITPNRFELSWLTGAPCDTVAGVEAAGQGLLRLPGPKRVLATSAPVSAEMTGVLEVTEAGAALYPTPRLASPPHGVGDVFAALVASGLPTGAALGRLQALIRESLGQDHLKIAEAAGAWLGAEPLASHSATQVADG